MAYFRKNEPVQDEPYMEEDEPEYDDGFDDLEEYMEIPELSKEERREINQHRARLAMNAGNLMGVIAGTVMILLLLTLLFSMVHFVITDLDRSFSLFSLKF